MFIGLFYIIFANFVKIDWLVFFPDLSTKIHTDRNFLKTTFWAQGIQNFSCLYFEPNNTLDSLRAGVCLRLEGFHKRTHNGSRARRKLWPHSCLIAAVFSRLHKTNAENMNSFMRDTLRRYNMKPLIHPILTEMLSVIYYMSDIPHLWRVLNTILN